MSQCPSCSKNIKIEESHYGTLFTCNHCQSVFFVGWDGVPEVANAEVAQPVDPIASDNFLTPVQSEPSFSDPTNFNPDTLNPSVTDFITPSSSGDFIQQSEPFASADPVEPIAHEPSGEDFSEVLEFANTTDDKGLIIYELTIQGIDHSELHKQVADALIDPKFNWQVEEVLSRIKDGVLVLESLTPAMTMVLVNRLKYLPVEIQWRQNVLTN